MESTELAKAQAEYEHAEIGLTIARKNLARQRKLARLGIRPIRQALRQGEAAGRFYPIPLARFRGGSSGSDSGRQDGV